MSEQAGTLSPWRQVFENSAWALVVVSPHDGKIEEVNRAYAEMHGYGRHELLGKPVIATISEESRLILPSRAKEIARSGHVVFESRQIRKDGSKFTALADTIAIRDKSGRVAYLAAHVHDISDMKKSEEHLRRSERHFRALAELPPQILWAADKMGQVNYLSTQWYDYTGIDAKRVGVSEALEKATHPEEIPRLREIWKKGVREGKPVEFEYRLKRRDGNYSWQLARAVPVRDGAGRITAWFGTTVDIDHQRRTIDRLQHDQRIREQVVSTLAHDLRNPLTAAKVAAQLLMKDLANSSANTALLEKVLSNIGRVDQMIVDLLDASRIRAGLELPIQMEYCDLRCEIDNTLEEFVLVHGPRFVLKATNAPLMGLWSCKDIRRILENLLQNAVKYGDRKTPITIEVSDGDGLHAQIAVHNQGKSIAPEDLSKIFDRFRRAGASEKGESEGWGIGLTLVRGIAEAHGGYVTVESSEEKGTTFTVTLPKRRES